MKIKKKKKPFMGRIPVPRPGWAMEDESKYNRKKKHKKKEPEQ